MAAGNRKSPKRAKSSESTYSLMEFMSDFPDDDACLEWLWSTRYANEDGTAYCPKCSANRTFTKYATKQQRQSWTCSGCGHHVHPTAGTIFHKSSTSLHLWFYAMYLMTSTRCGISAKQLERELGVTYKTAWRMFHLIRNELMYQDDEPLSGAVEMDEMYFAGKTKRAGEVTKRRPGKPVPKRSSAPVFGMVERGGGRVRAVHVEDTKTVTLLPHVMKYVVPESVVYTDEYSSYKSLPKHGYDHRTISHKDSVYVSGDVHTQTIEGFWSLVRRGIAGTHHMVSAKHLQGYLNEYVFRYNRDDNGPDLFAVLLLRAALTRV
ncbi:MAG TPA: IS1595 family transposase [Mycobacteriales bacterium]|nr:IS1595 family transposase [Mycobacteriales bacterium]